MDISRLIYTSREQPGGLTTLTPAAEAITVLPTPMNPVASIWFMLVTLLTGGVAISILLAMNRRLPRASRGTRPLLLVLVLASALLLFRPHEDTFTGLDTSCYRLMGQSFAAGRGFHDRDLTLLSLPRHLRRAVLLEYEHWGRDTRDRSFEIPDLRTCVTRPYFYPTLPLAAAGMEITTRIFNGDYFVPLMGLFFVIAILATGAGLGNKTGLIAATALLAGTPLPAYLLRGYYAEAVGAVLAALVLLGRSLSIQSPSFRVAAPLLLGLSVCFHPVMIAVALPALILLLMDATLSKRGTLLTLAAFATGLVPLVIMTRTLCQPYGNIIDFGSILHNISIDPVHRLLALFVVVFAAGIGLILLGPSRFKDRLITDASRVLLHPWLFPLVLLAAAVPLLVSTFLWTGKPMVITGLREYADGVRWSYGVILLAAAVSALRAPNTTASRSVLVLTILVSPLFFYLKGFEQMGLWSQRRLIPLVLLLIVALAPALSAFCGSFTRRRFVPLAVSALLIGAALVNPLRWPAPYLARHEHGTGNWVAALSGKLGTHFTVFDYYPYSVPFAVTGKTRAVGLSEYGASAWPRLAAWLSALATREPVRLVTAYTNPGLEDGIILKEVAREHLSTTRVVSKTALPAESRERVFELGILEVSPATDQAGLAVHKILDDGPLALRGPWGRGSAIRQGDSVLPARWSREGSGIMGPVPKPGQTVTVTLVAAASRDDGVAGQTLRLQPPWGGPSLPLTISNDLTRVAGTLTAPVGTDVTPGETGVYRFYASTPYNPRKAGIRGYEPDLGARIHSITITRP